MSPAEDFRTRDQFPPETKSKEAQNPLAIAGFLYSGLTTYYKSGSIIYDGYADEECVLVMCWHEPGKLCRQQSNSCAIRHLQIAFLFLKSFQEVVIFIALHQRNIKILEKAKSLYSGPHFVKK